ncbi:membrane protein insertase YidC, partial [uncultured Stenotrophomonas sp.]|uniref:membrane protein insertase YidC n=1 Tax=uncultured Stenotrophomonas sp. TaxID=165438 RepID=UPI0028E73919
MNQTRVFLIVAWLMVAILLWMEWGRDKTAPAPTAPVAAQTQGTVPGAAGTVPSANVPQAPGSAPAVQATAPAAAAAGAPRVTVTTDVLRLVLDGGNVLDAELLQFPQTKADGSPPVRLLTEDPAHPYRAVTGWTSQDKSMPVPEASGFTLVGDAKDFVLAKGQNELQIPFVWNGPNGVTIRRTFTVNRNEYAVKVKDEVVNAGTTPWSGYVYRTLDRTPTILSRSMTNPDSFSFNGATWFDNDGKYQRRAFKDFLEDGPLNQQVTGGWVAMLQHHFFTAWVPQKDQAANYQLSQHDGRDQIQATGPAFTVAPGSTASTEARLWVGPKLVNQIAKEDVPGLDRVVDYSRFSIMAVIGQGLFWVLNQVHKVVNNWGWAIVGLVVLLKLVLYPLSAVQYKSGAKMRRFQPRIAQLKERYGDDRQKFQTAMMELYK